mmetsp:Transcript_42671/g.65455  ORF Transcript_42671/g.65455 Transcript_42671/m.65455 type:complete len:253 (-) Transcript_42671:248-1006(-)
MSCSSLENIHSLGIVGSLKELVVGNQVLGSLIEVSELVLVGTGHLHEFVSEQMVKLQALPAVVDAFTVEYLGGLLGVELSGHNRVVLGFHRGDPDVASLVAGVACHIPEGSKALVALHGFGGNGPRVTIQSEVAVLEVVQLVVVHSAVHLGLEGVDREVEGHAQLVSSNPGKSIIRVGGSEESQSLEAQAGSPLRVEGAIVILSYDFIVDHLAHSHVVTATAGVEDTVNFGELILGDFFRLAMDERDDLSAC